MSLRKVMLRLLVVEAPPETLDLLVSRLQVASERSHLIATRLVIRVCDRLSSKWVVGVKPSGAAGADQLWLVLRLRATGATGEERDGGDDDGDEDSTQIPRRVRHDGGHGVGRDVGRRGGGGGVVVCVSVGRKFEVQTATTLCCGGGCAKRAATLASLAPRSEC